jgi:hypothetical protein
MGGMGSGTWTRRDKKSTADQFRWLNVHCLHRDNALYPGHHFTVSWTRGGSLWGEIRVEVEANCLLLFYHHTVGRKSQNIRERVHLDWSRCNYGGERPWFLCPGCGRRVGILFLGGSYFLCRHCYHLSYSSQNENTVLGRMSRTAGKLRDRLGEKCWQKPKGMHQKTYDRLRRRLLYADMLADQLLDQEMEKLRSRGIWD